ncbi:MAG: hypothetical protein ACFE9S_08450 [Candidatus Hermodarchaeota archaeon]
MVIIIIKEILKNLKDKKVSVYVRDVAERSWFSGVLEDITDDNIALSEKSDYSECRYYIPLTEIVVVSESVV